jgi:hypothetical protein
MRAYLSEPVFSSAREAYELLPWLPHKTNREK